MSMTFRLDRFDELLDELSFDEELAADLVDAGYVLRPGRFRSFAVGVNALHLIPAKAVHEDVQAASEACPAPAATTGGAR